MSIKIHYIEMTYLFHTTSTSISKETHNEKKSDRKTQINIHRHYQRWRMSQTSNTRLVLRTCIWYSLFEPSHEKRVIVSLSFKCACAVTQRGQRSSFLCSSKNSDGSGETARMRSSPEPSPFACVICRLIFRITRMHKMENRIAILIV